MALTLAESKVGMSDKVAEQVIDEFRRGSILLDKLTFDNTVSPGTNGSTLTYSYQRLETPATAGFRNINSEYTSQEAKRKKASADLKIFGGVFELDRVIATTSGAIDEMDFQLKEKIKATINVFHNQVINGDAGVTGFDGLDVMLAGKNTEINAGAENAIDLSTSAAVDSNYKKVLDLLDEFLASFNGKPDMIMANSFLITKLKQCARRAGYLTPSEDSFGNKVDSYNGIPFLDLEYYFDGTNTLPTVRLVERTHGGTTVTGLTDLYGARLGLDGFHGASLTGTKLINTYLPDLKAPGAVKKGEVEMVAATVLKNSRSAGVLRNFKVK